MAGLCVVADGSIELDSGSSDVACCVILHDTNRDTEGRSSLGGNAALTRPTLRSRASEVVMPPAVRRTN